MVIDDIMKLPGFSREQLAARFGIPDRTIYSWIRQERKPPEYVLTLLTYIYMLEGGMKDVKEECRLEKEISGGSERSPKARKKGQSENGKT